MNRRLSKITPAAFKVVVDVKPDSEVGSSGAAFSETRIDPSAVARLLKAHEQDRSRIAREIHDNLGGRVTEVVLLLYQMSRQVPTTSPNFPSELNRLLKKVTDLAQSIRSLSQQLHSPVLKFAGIVPALELLCREFKTNTGIQLRFTASAPGVEVSDEVAMCLYRIAQESLTNIARHSGAKRATVKLKHTVDKVHLTISDPGKGFSTKSMGRNGLGLISMQERVRLVHGALQVRTCPGAGTRVHAIVTSSQPPANA